MNLAAGTRLGPYEVLALLGAGGMGEVYRACDTTLGRDVALKVLPAAVAADADRLARFEREAKTLASLNHPHIAQIYGFERAAEPPALAMEFVDGEDLAGRLTRGPIPIDEALPIARQIAEALEAAHEAGIVHRDLKPANIKLRADGVVKVLDFGLAKALDPAGSTSSSFGSIAPTIASPANVTAMGVILGTAAYMAPEQARGKAVDRRSDIWAFGIVLFEMLTGARLFHGDSVSDSVAAVLTRAPDWTRLPPATPESVQTLLRRCLERDPRRRLQAIGEARVVLEDPGASPTRVDPPADRRIAWRTIAAAAAAGVALLAAGWLARPTPRTGDRNVRKVDLAIADLDANRSRAPAISPDGSRVAFVAGNRLRVRRLDSFEATELTEGTDVAYFSWSPDSRALAFVRRGRAWKVSTEGGQPIELGAVPADLVGSAGSAWTSDGQVVFAGSDTVGLWTLSASGGSGRELLAIDRAAEADLHEIASLPGGRGLIFTVHRRNKPSDMIAVLSGGTRRTVLEVAGEELRFPVYSHTGHLLYERVTANPGIWAVPFSLDRLETTGAPVLVVPRGSSPSLAGDGTLCFVGADEAPIEIVRVSRSGTVEKLGDLPESATTSMVAAVQTGAGYRPSAGLSLSPDATRLAISFASPGRLIVFDLERGSLSQVATGSFAARPVWTARGDRLVYGSAREARGWNLWSRRADGAGEEQRLSTSDEVQLPLAISPDGSTLVFSEGTGPTGANFKMPADASGPKQPLLSSRAWGSSASFSPDGRWLAYESVEADRMEVFLRRFPDGDERIKVSTAGGEQPVWSKSNEIFYLAGGIISAVSVTSRGGSLAVSKPVALVPTGGDTNLVSVFDVTPDGQHFLTLRSRARQHLGLIFNWPADLVRLK